MVARFELSAWLCFEHVFCDADEGDELRTISQESVGE